MTFAEIKRIFKDGLIDNNPTFVQVLGTCPSLATTTSVQNGIGMGVSAMAVLVCSNLVISLLRNFIPSKIRIAAYVVIIAGFVTCLDLVLQAFVPSLSESLGVFIPLIVVNCIILARAEAFAAKNKPLPSVLDGIAMGLGFTVALFFISAVREILGNGSFLGIPLFGDHFEGASLITMAPGGFIVFGTLIAVVQYLKNRRKKEVL